MGARFIGGDREQVFLMPPSVGDPVPEGHLVWTVLDAVGELDLSVFYGDYRADGHGRPAYEPSMMVVALLLYAYARANRSARGIERACVEDVAYRVVAGNVAPDHSTIAEFRCRHERALGEIFSGVLGLCARAGLASVGVVAIDGTKMSANASINANRDFGQIARERLYQVLGPLRDFRPDRIAWHTTYGNDCEHSRGHPRSSAMVRGHELTHRHARATDRRAKSRGRAAARRDRSERKERDEPRLHHLRPARRTSRSRIHAGLPNVQGKGLNARASWEDDVRSNADVVGPDALIRDSLPALFWLIDNAETENEMDDLRRLANILLTTRSRREDEDLDQVVGAATYAYGELRGILLAEPRSISRASTAPKSSKRSTPVVLR